MQQGQNNQIVNGVIWKQLLFFFFPIVVGTLFQQLYNTVDAVIVGRFVGKEALAGVGGSALAVTFRHTLPSSLRQTAYSFISSITKAME